jgi:hypothetical protein
MEQEPSREAYSQLPGQEIFVFHGTEMFITLLNNLSYINPPLFIQTRFYFNLYFLSIYKSSESWTRFVKRTYDPSIWFKYFLYMEMPVEFANNNYGILNFSLWKIPIWIEVQDA